MSTIDKEAMRWLMRQTGKSLDAAERDAFDAWYAADIRHQGAYLRATAINNALDSATVQETLRPERARLEMEWTGASWRQNPPRRQFMRSLAMYGGLAAGVAALGMAMLIRPEDAAETLFAAAKGEYRRVPLADRSVASINSGGQIEVRLGSDVRQVSLHRGEAWFEVAKDKSRPFVVDAADTRVRAVGTAFGVRRYANGAEVLVTEGVVEIWSSTGAARKRLLRAGDSAFVAQNAADITVQRQPDEVARKLAWREGKVIFVNQTLNEAVADFNRYSIRKIVVADPRLGTKTLVGQYPIDAPELFAKDVSAFLGVPVEITAERILIGAQKI